MPTMTIPSANLRRLKKLAAEAKSSSVEGGGRHPRADLRGRSPPPPMTRRRENRAALLALAAAYDSDEARSAGAGEDGRDAAAAATGFAVGARVLVRAPVAASVGTAAQLMRSVVVSGVDEDGYLEVVYEGASSLPGGGEDPFATVCPPRDQIVVDAPPRVVTATSYATGGAGSEASSSPGAERLRQG